MPGVSDVIDRLSLRILLIRVDLPTLGFPMNAIRLVLISEYISELVIENVFFIKSSNPLLVLAET